jgi:hypothetical protein
MKKLVRTPSFLPIKKSQAQLDAALTQQIRSIVSYTGKKQSGAQPDGED